MSGVEDEHAVEEFSTETADPVGFQKSVTYVEQQLMPLVRTR
jgi:hypothetical protein